MNIQDIKPAEGSRRPVKRVGRGIGSGHGKTSCKGHKGQKARSGGPKGAGFEGGQMPLQRRLPKRGFKNRSAIKYAVVNLETIDKLQGVDVVTPEVLLERGVIKDVMHGVKVLGKGDIKRPVTVKAAAFSESAAERIKAAGGSIEVV